MQNNLHQFKQKFKPLAEAFDAGNGFLSEPAGCSSASASQDVALMSRRFESCPSVFLSDKLKSGSYRERSPNGNKH